MHNAAITSEISIGEDEPLALIGGPCVLESAQAAVDLASRISEVCKKLRVPLVFKASFDKANRTSIHSFRGPSLDKGLEMLAEVRRQVGVPVLTDIHEPHQAAAAAQVVDVLQIPAFLCRQTDLLQAAAAAGRAVNIKKAPFLSPEDMRHVVEKVESGGGKNILVTERGTMFGYNDLVVDFRSLTRLRALGYPVVFDATHSVQKPGGEGIRSGGDRRYVGALLRAAAAVGIDAIYCEIHPSTSHSPSDAATVWPLDALEELLQQTVMIDLARRALRAPL